MDSDKLSLNDEKPEKEKLKKELEYLGIQVHILNKRAMENYMPKNVLNNLPKINRKYLVHSNWIKAYKNYTNEKIDFLNYKEEISQFSNFKDEFPKFFENQRFVFKDSLLEREGGNNDNNEFLEIIGKINHLL